MEKTYLIIKRSGIFNMIIGIGTIITGGFLILYGTKLFKECSKLTF